MPSISFLTSSSVMFSSPSSPSIEATIDRALAPWSTTPSTGPKHPRHGWLARMQVSPQPVRVAGPRQITPWSRKHFSGSSLICHGLFTSSIDSLSGLDSALGQVSHRALLGASTAPFSGSSPLRMASTAFIIKSGGGGQPGR